jgi:hypothetical protein
MNRRAIRLRAGSDGKPPTMKDLVFWFSGFPSCARKNAQRMGHGADLADEPNFEGSRTRIASLENDATWQFDPGVGHTLSG